MESNNYLSQIGMDLFYFQHIHHNYPQTIFMSYPLFYIIINSGNIECHSDGRKTYYGIPVQAYQSDKLEYHFAVSKYEF